MSSTKTTATAEAIAPPIREIAANLESLRDFVDVLESHLGKKSKETVDTHKDVLGPLLLAFERAGRLYPELGLEDLPKEVVEDLERKYSGTEGIEIERTDAGGFSMRMTPRTGRSVSDALRDIQKSTTRTRMLYSSSLLNLASSVELFFAKLLHSYFRLHPEAVGVKDKIFSFEDLSEFTTIADARAHYVLSKIEDLLRGSLADWLAFLREKVKLSMGYLRPDVPALEETFYRRNIVVHNGGIVNSIYLAKVAPIQRNGVQLGTNLTPSREYLNERIDLWEKVCVLIAAELWKQLDPEDDLRADLLAEIAYKHLLAARWSISEAISRFIMADKQMPESVHTVAQLNCWQCHKWTDRWHEVEEEVKSADYSAKGLLYQLGLLALEDKFDEFFELLPRALRAGELGTKQLQEFPIFQKVRQDPRYTASIQEPESKPAGEGQTEETSPAPGQETAEASG